MSDRINCRNCIHFNDLEHRCCLNDGKAIKKECYFILSNRKPKGKDVVIENLKTKIADLEEKLAESEKKAKDLEFRNKNLEHSLKVAPNANAGQRKRIVELKEINHKLKQQLAEKTLTIEQINKAFIENRSLWKGKYEQANQDKISFCIEKLDNLKSFIKEKAKFETGDYEIVYSDDILEEIENQIEEIKKENR